MNSPRRPTHLQERVPWRDRTQVLTHQSASHGTQMAEGANKLARGRIPEACSATFICRQDPSAARTKRPVPETCNLGIGQGSDQLALGRIPEFGGFVPASREDPS